MVFIAWRSAGLLLLCVGGIAASIAVLWWTRWKSWVIKVPVSIVAALLILIFGATFLLFSFFVSVDSDNHSRPIYSPDRKKAVRGENWGGFGTSYGTSVLIYTWYGIRSELVFSSEGNPPDVKDIIWSDDRHLVIQFPKEDEDFQCRSARNVKVQCVAMLSK